MGLREKLYDFRNRLRDRHMFSIIIVLLAISLALGVALYKKQTEYRQASENAYNLAFFEVVGYIDNVQNWLAKSLISSSSSQAAENLINVWREANLAMSYLSAMPIEANELANATKFLNQVSEYSYTLSKKNIEGEGLTEEDFNNLQTLYTYAESLRNTLNELCNEINEGDISWGELTKKGNVAFAKEVDNISKDSFANLTKNFEEYAGLIYDGAFSEHINQGKQKALTGENITEEEAVEIVKQYVDMTRVDEIFVNGLIENAQIPAYDFTVKLKDSSDRIYLSITQKEGRLLLLSYNRNFGEENIKEEEAIEIAKEFLAQHGFDSMKETYYMKQDGSITINFAYQMGDIVVYADLIKVKIALDNGEVLGLESSGYLNSHTERTADSIYISKEKAKESLNKDIEILSENLAIIPTEWNTEILCWEFKGRIYERDFLVYVNVETGKEENILMIINTPNGTLTM